MSLDNNKNENSYAFEILFWLWCRHLKCLPYQDTNDYMYKKIILERGIMENKGDE